MPLKLCGIFDWRLLPGVGFSGVDLGDVGIECVIECDSRAQSFQASIEPDPDSLRGTWVRHW